MTTDAQWNLDLADALSFEARFSAAQHVLPTPAERESLRPTFDESQRAVANIRAWRKYLPEACVARMIDDGWQWST